MSKQFVETPAFPDLVAVSTENNARMLALATECQQALVELSRKRMESYAELPGRFVNCRSPADVLNLQLEFLATAQSDYLSQFRQMSDNLLARQPEIEERGESYGRTLLNAQKDAEKIIALAKEQAERIIAEANNRAAPHEKRSNVA